MYLITIPVTFELPKDGGWWHPDSDWWAAARREGFEHPAPEDPFFWSTGLAISQAEELEWMAAGAALNWYVETKIPAPRERFALVGWSHGGQVAVHALNRMNVANSARLRLVTLGTPVREGMRDLYLWAGSVAAWTHVFSMSDMWQVAEEISEEFRLPFFRRFAWAEQNVNLGEGVAHTALVEPWVFEQEGIWGWLREGLQR